jgi:phospholipase C
MTTSRAKFSFDHSFGIYPNAAEVPGEPGVYPAPSPARPNGYMMALLNSNPN